MLKRTDRPIIEGYRCIPLVMDDVAAADNWVFCVGLARSGSTALCRLVSRHPDALLLNEAGLFVYSSLLRSRLVRIGPGENIHNAELAHALEGGGIAASLIRELMEQMRRHVRGAPALFGDKLGHYGHCLEELLAVFPGCRLVAADRDAWDATASFMDLEWYRQRHCDLTPDELAHRTLGICHANRERLRQMRRRCTIHVVDFEDMVSRPHETLRDLFDFLGLDSNPSTYDYESAVSSTSHGTAVGHWKRVAEVRQLRERFEANHETEQAPSEEIIDSAGGAGSISE